MNNFFFKTSLFEKRDEILFQSICYNKNIISLYQTIFNIFLYSLSLKQVNFIIDMFLFPVYYSNFLSKYIFIYFKTNAFLKLETNQIYLKFCKKFNKKVMISFKIKIYLKVYYINKCMTLFLLNFFIKIIYFSHNYKKLKVKELFEKSINIQNNFLQYRKYKFLFQDK